MNQRRADQSAAGRPNIVAGSIILAQHTGQELPFPIPRDDDWHSPNTEMQRCAVWLKAYPPGHRLHDQVVERALANFNEQRTSGFMKLRGGNEFNSDGHALHWIRGIAAIHTTALEQGEEMIVKACLWWWGCWYWLADLTATPDNKVIALGGRFEGGWREERDVACRLMIGELARAIDGKRFWQNAEKVSDLFGLHLLRKLQERGALDDLVSHQPISASPYSIARHENGHVTRGEGLKWERPRSRGEVKVCWTRYADGAIGYDEPPPDLGLKLSRVSLETPKAEGAA